MSLESKIEELIAAVQANTEALKAISAGGVTTVNNASGGESAKGEAKTETEGKRGPGRPKKNAEEPKDEPKSEKNDAKEDVSDDDIRTVFGAFMRVDEAEERESRKNFVKKLLDGYGVPKALEIPASKRAEALAKVKAEQKRREEAADEDGDLV